MFLNFTQNLIQKATLVFCFSLFLNTLHGQDSGDAAIKRFVDLDINNFRTQLVDAPVVIGGGFGSEFSQITLPLPEGGEMVFRVVESSIMSPEFEAVQPEFKTYRLRAVTDQTILGRLCITPYGLNAFIFTPKGILDISPEDLLNPINHRVEYGDLNEFELDCETANLNFKGATSSSTANKTGITNGGTLRTYDLAVVGTGEFHDANGGTVAAAQAVVTTSVNDIQAIYERELAVQFMLLTPFIYTDFNTDPFTVAGGSRTSQAASAVATNWPTGNYDIGHVFHDQDQAPAVLPGGGVAGLGVVCSTNPSGTGFRRAAGWSGSFNNTSTGWIRLAAHEFGHMFDMPHTFNGGGNNNCNNNISTTTSYEIASGTTIMSYRGICGAGQNIPASPNNGDDYFHTNSIERAVNYMNTQSCHTGTATGNTPPVVTGCTGTHTIPISTPFRIIGSGTDADGDAISYVWEQYDEDGAGTPTQGKIGAAAGSDPLAPLFRSYPPSTNGNERTFPNINLVVANSYSSDFEPLPSVARTMNFRLTGRDFKPGGGGIHCDDIDVTVSASGPLTVTAPNGGGTLTAGSATTITWAVNSTNTFSANVNIKLSLDGGLTYPITLATNTVNDGTESVTIPAGVSNTSTARIMVESTGDPCVVFFDISDADFTITSNCLAPSTEINPTTACSFPVGAAGLNLSMSNNLGSVITSPISGAIDGTETITSTSKASVLCGTLTCNLFGGGSFFYDTYEFYVDVSGNYSFEATTSNFSEAVQLYQGDWSVSSQCNNLLGSTRCHNPPNLISGARSIITSNLTTNQKYTLVVSNFFFGTQTGNYDVTVTPPAGGNIYDGIVLPANYSYTYIAVNNATNVIDAESASSDFTSLPAGNYDIYGVVYYSGSAPPNPATPSSWVTTPFSSILGSSTCQLVSSNNKVLTVLAPTTLDIPATCTSPLINFNNFDGTGFESSPGTGQLSSVDWTWTGMSTTYNPSGSNSTGDYARGTTTGGESTGGVYAYDVGGDQALWIQPGGSDWTPGTVNVNVCNNSGATMVDLDLSYDLLVLNDQDRSNTFNFQFSTDAGANYTQVASLDFTSVAPKDAAPTVQTTAQSATLTGVNLADGACMLLEWYGDDAGGSGSRDEFGLDNISICPAAAVCNLATSGLTNIQCNDGGTPSDPSDDFITFDLNPTGSNLGTTYTITGATPATGTYGAVTSFTAAAGTAGAGNLSITITDGTTGTCTLSETVMDPGSCSGTCNLATSGLTNIQCNDGGTPSDPSDDFITFDLNPTGSNLGTTYTITGATPATGTYGAVTSFTTAAGTAGAGNLSITITDGTTGTCTLSETVMDPGSCSGTCNLATSGLTNIQCNDGGTPSDPSDDFITFDLNPTGSNLGTTYTITGATPATGTYGAVTSFTAAAGTAGAGNLSITITDGTTGTCTLSETVMDPGSCSGTCNLATSGLTNIQCNDGGTPSDPSDDFITFDLNPTGSNLGTTYTITGATPATGTYGAVTSFTTAAGTAGAGNLSITITDGTTGTCTLSETVMDPGSCSGTCNLATSGLTNIQCNDGGTPSDPSDDFITFDLNPTGSNLGTTYTITGATPATGTYGAVTSFTTAAGTAGAGNLSITITDGTTGTCMLSATVTDPGTCSGTCNLATSGLTNIQCNDGGTPSDPSDDFITFDLNPTGSNLGTTYTITGATPATGTYGAVTSFTAAAGTAGAGNLSITITDGTTGTCTLSETVMDPGSCSGTCNLATSGLTNIQCNDGGTPSDPSDDFITFDLNPTGSNLGTTYTITGATPATGTYGAVTSFTAAAGTAGAGNLSITITDGTTGTCTLSETVMDPGSCSGTCNLATSGLTNIQCNDGGTPSDPSDDFITFDLNPTGSNLGTTYTITGATPATGTYGAVTSFTTAAGTAGAGNLSITITDGTTGTCTLSETVMDPGSCSGTCNLATSGLTNIQCNDGGTPSDPSDDFITFDLNPTGSNLGTTYTITGATPATGTYGAVTSFTAAAGTAGAGNLSITITDGTTGTCTLSETVMDPGSCSGTCNLATSGLTNIQCNDGGTPSDPSDDFITFDLNPTGSNLGTTYTITGATPATGTYGAVTSFTTAAGTAGAGNLSITITDGTTGTCTLSETVMDPGSCSGTCNLATSGLTNIQCNDGGTPSDPSDDFITFDLNPTGSNLGTTYTITGATPATGTYGAVTSFTTAAGTAGAGNLSITITDGMSGTCMLSETVTDPGTCSGTCNLATSGLTNIQCNDGGTPSDPSDDFITFDLNPTGSNLGTTYTITGATPATGTYGAVTSFTTAAGTAGAGNLSITITDGMSATCTFSETVTDPGVCSTPPTTTIDIPADCSSALIDFTGYDGTGFANPPAAGQLSSADWTITGLSQGYVPGGTNTNGDHTGFTATGGESGGGIYAYDPGSNPALWVQPTGSDWTPGTFNVKVCNNSGATMVDLDVSYDLLVLNDQDRANTFNFEYSTDGTTFTNVPALDYTSPLAKDASPTVQTITQSTTLTGINLADGACIYLGWSGGDAGGSGSRDEFGLDNIKVCPPPPTCNLAASGLSNIQCNDNGTPTNPTDDFITFELNPTGVGLGASYSVTGGTPATGSYGASTTFSTALGTASNINGISITISDVDDLACTLIETVNSNGTCSMSPTISQTDTNGDQVPDIMDPCSCADPLNVESGGLVTYFHDFVRITSNPGETWTLTAITSGMMFNNPPTPPASPITVGTVIPETAPGSGVYYIDLWTPSNVGFMAEFNRTVNPLAIPLSTGGTCSATTCNTCDIMANVTTTSPTCPGGNDGTITVNATCTTCTGLEYTRDNGATWVSTPTFTGLSAGTYDVFARDTGDPTCQQGVASFVLTDGIDNTAPTTATCPNAPINVSTDAGVCTAVVTYAAPTFDDNCDGNGLAGTLTAGLASGSAFPLGTTTVTFEYTDVAGNGPAICTFDIIVADNVNPTAVCMDATVQLDASGMVTVLASDIDGGSTDNCAITSSTVSPNPLDCSVITGGGTPPVNDLVITAAFDGPLSGGTPKGIELYAINDIPDLSIYGVGSANNGGGSDGEEFTFPAVALTAGQHIYVATETAMFTNFFGFAPDFNAGFAIGINGDDAVELFKNGIVIDVFGDINVDGTGEPWDHRDGWAYRVNATGPDGSTFVLANWTFSGTDALDGETTNAGATTPVPIGTYNFPLGNGTAMVTLTVSDAAGNSDNCTATVTVEDNIAPTATCLPTFTATLNANGTVIVSPSDINNGSTDNCGIASMEVSPNMVDCSNIGNATTITLTVTDIDGNTSTCTSNVDASDVTAPTAICTSAIACLDANGMASVTAADVDGGSFDNCGNVTLSMPGNSYTCLDIAPLTPPGALVISGVIDATLSGGVPKAIEFYAMQDIPDLSIYGFGSANNGGGSDGEEFSFPSGALSAGDFIYVTSNLTAFSTWFGQAADFSSNAASINGDDAIELFENGVVIDVFGDINTDGSGQPWEYTDGWAYRVNATGPDGTTFVLGNFNYSGRDALDGESDNATAATPFPIGTYTFPQAGGTAMVTLTVTDDEGNSATCDANVLILDKIAPVATCQPGSVTLGANGTATIDGSLFDGGSTDNCGNITDYSTDPTEADCSMVGITQITVNVLDLSGNAGSCTADLSTIASASCTPPNIGNEGGPNIADPCTCLGNGLFEEEVVIGPAGAGQAWVIQATNLIDPATGVAYPQGTPLTEMPDPNNPGRFIYTISGNHLDGVGYILEASSPFYPGQSLSISNKCFYPEAQILQNFGDFCLNTPLQTFTGFELSGADGTGQFFFEGVAVPTTDAGNGNWQAAIDVASMGLGFFTVRFEFDAGNPPGADKIGCVGFIEQIINVTETPSTVACNDNVQVSLNDDCEAFVTPDMILEGSYVCYDDYELTMTDSRGVVTNPLTGAHIGRTITATMTHLISGNSCWSSVTVEDKLGPVITCSVDRLDKAGNVVESGNVFSITCDVDPATIPAPTAEDCTFRPDVYLKTETITGDECNVLTITRVYGSTDEDGNDNPDDCTITINISQPDVTFPEDVTWSCQQYNAFPNVADATAMHPLIIANAADIDQALLCLLPGLGGDDVAGVDPYGAGAYWLDGEDLDISLDPRYDDDIDNPITDNNGACGNTTAETDALECFANFSYHVINEGWDTDYLRDCDLNPGGHVPNIIRTPNHVRNAPLLSYPNDHQIRGIEDKDVLEVTGSGVPNVAMTDKCTYSVTFKDQRVEACAGQGTDGSTFKIIRTWTVLNWCTGQTQKDVQVIKVLDRKAPTIEFAADYESDLVSNQPSSNTDHPDCRSNGLIDVPVIEDDCSGIASIRVFTPVGEATAVMNAGVIVGFEIPSPYLEMGIHNITYQVEDNCGNSSSADATVRVIDGIPPVAVCREITQIALSAEVDGVTAIAAELFDEGSYDYCGDIFFKVRRMERPDCDGFAIDRTRFNDAINFCCTDIGTTVNVVLRVYDVDPGDGAVSTSTREANANDCMVEVLVEDKSRPHCVAPADVWTNCNDIRGNVDYENIDDLNDLFGQATASDNCAATIEELAPDVDVDLCGVGTITRTFRATDTYGNRHLGRCEQTIMIMQQTEYTVTIPGDFQEECDDASPQDLEYAEIACDLLAVSQEDKRFYANEDGECMKIIRTWKVINWCEYDGASPVSVIPRLDTNNDGAPGDGNGGSRTPVNHSGPGEWISTGGNLIFTANPLIQIRGGGYYSYEQHIKIYDNTAPSLEYNGDTEFCGGDRDEDPCTGEVDIMPAIDELCTEVTVEWSLTAFSDSFGSADFSGTDNLTGRYPLGTHTARFFVSDECGNISEIDITFEIIDCKAPTPVCYNGLSIDVMPLSGMVEIWASDYDASSFDYCHPYELRINRVVDTNNDGVITSDDYQTTVPQFDSVQFTCADAGTFVTVQMWVGEISGDNVNNWDYCVSYMDVQDNNGVCSTSGSKVALGGKIANEEGESVENVMVELNNGMNDLTTANGEFYFAVPYGSDITVTPMRTDDAANGVSTFDLLLISKHILNVEKLNSPYKIIAADANNTGNISTLDLIAIRKVILRVADEFPNNTSWRFVDKTYAFQNAADPLGENFPELKTMNNVSDNLEVNFTAIKVGDVNGDAEANSILGVDGRTFNGNMIFRASTRNSTEQNVKAGETFEIAFTTAQAVEGYQFTMTFDEKAVALNSIENGLTNDNNFNVIGNQIATSWNLANGVPANTEMFSLTFLAKADLNASDVLAIGSEIVKAEAYNAGELMNVSLDFGQGATASTFELMQNTPNPFEFETTIGFNLPEATSATLKISDVSGKILRVIEGDYAKGYNEVRLEMTNDLPAGVLIYDLETPTHNATRKMTTIK